MKILVIHTRYVEKGGEDSLVDLEINLLRQEHEVELLQFQNKSGWRGLIQFLFSIWNPAAGKKVRRKILDFRPDLVHVHNWHFAAGPIVFHAVAKQGIPIVATLHNYRILCPSATLFHHEKLFFESLKNGFPWRAVQKKTYRNSILLSFWLSLILYFHRKIGTWNFVDSYLVPSASMLPFFEQVPWKFPMNKVIVKPNFTEPAPTSNKEKTNFLYVGRLSEEKGIRSLLDAFIKTKQPLLIAGDGPLKPLITDATSKYNWIRYAGSLNKPKVNDELTAASALIVPSIWQEPFGMVIIESFAHGTPVIAANIGAPAHLIQHNFNGLLFEPGNAASIAEAVQQWNKFSIFQKKQMSANAIRTYEEYYTPKKNLQELNRIYQSCM
ncbi:MAG: glycosyltransferase [Flavihumibacter sp.]|nr:glycosyltransferase [Flavihumibacter sp.]